MTSQYNKKKLMRLTPYQFEKIWNKIMDGEVTYKTMDNRVLNFRDGTEVQQRSYITIRREFRVCHISKKTKGNG